jgi:hypothetical protein
VNENDNANTTATGGSQGGKEPGAACAHTPEEDDANISSTVELPLPGPADDARAATATRKEGEDRGREEIGSAQRARPAVPPANCEDAPGDKPDTAQTEEDNAASALPIPPPAKKEAETDEGKKSDEGDEAGSAEPAPPPVIFDDEEIERRKAAIKGNKDLPRVNDAAAVAGGRSKLRIVVWHLAARHLPPIEPDLCDHALSRAAAIAATRSSPAHRWAIDRSLRCRTQFLFHLPSYGPSPRAVVRLSPRDLDPARTCRARTWLHDDGAAVAAALS